MAAQLTKREHRRLTRFAICRQHSSDNRSRVARQADAEHQGRQIIEMNSDRGLGRAAGVGSSLRREWQAGERTDRRQHQRADRTPVVQGVGIAATLSSKPTYGDAA